MCQRIFPLTVQLGQWKEDILIATHTQLRQRNNTWTTVVQETAMDTHDCSSCHGNIETSSQDAMRASRSDQRRESVIAGLAKPRLRRSLTLTRREHLEPVDSSTPCAPEDVVSAYCGGDRRSSNSSEFDTDLEEEGQIIRLIVVAITKFPQLHVIYNVLQHTYIFVDTRTCSYDENPNGFRMTRRWPGSNLKKYHESIGKKPVVAWNKHFRGRGKVAGLY